MQTICFEDQFVDRLRPITLSRPAYAINCASLTLLDWLQELPGNLTVDVRPHLATIERLDRKLEAPANASDPGGVVLVNARIVPKVELASLLKTLCESDESTAIFDEEDGVVLLARITAADIASQQSAIDQADSVTAGLIEIAATLGRSETSVEVLRHPHEVVFHHMALMPDAMQWRLEHGDYKETADGVFAAEGATLGNYSVVDTSEGPILLDKDVEVGPFCFLSGPVYAGPRARVLEHAALKDGVALGHTTKIGGEVEASVIEPFTNKQHHGFLGHSYLGSWINLGAGTCNSDLKNTYGKINMTYGDKKIATGMQFLGCIIGDYSKTAINTSIFTGKVIGVCSMLYGFATENVPSYVNYARLFGQTSLLPADVMINTQQRMFARRKVQQRECDMQLIRDMYSLTESERAEAIEHDGL
ncbi:putative sugar nucleotidyl transferase [Planctomycetes bacterium K23_9]|uniref:Glucosamine-1-phosphate N-acetyltransferase n=1 Tax=Stieleria marina TaxID=1930275 RepID=A0A517NUT9_9BACT|nr:hypothetical protein K239x_28800 [Planctomycetes bacterium K23_9]